MTVTPHMSDRGRLLPVVRHDRESEARTPGKQLYRIPADAQDAYGSMAPTPLVGSGESDLTRIAQGRPKASGQAIVITGRVLDEDLRPVRRTLIEVWNANAGGRYSHDLDAANHLAPLDPNFYGFGRLVTDDEGWYRLKTIKPGAYIARADIAWWRPPHVHFSVVGNGVRLVTQMYFPTEPLNEQDFIYLIVPEAERARVIGKTTAPSEGDPAFRFDMVIRGRHQTPPDFD